MKPTRKLNRRSFMAKVAGGVAAVGALGVLATDEAQAVQSGCTDSDSGPNSDSPGYGRSCGNRRRTGCTDSDTGPNSDPPGNGRCNSRPVRNRTGCTDSDGGRYADGVGYGRHCGRRRTGYTDRDRPTSRAMAGAFAAAARAPIPTRPLCRPGGTRPPLLDQTGEVGWSLAVERPRAVGQIVFEA